MFVCYRVAYNAREHYLLRMSNTYLLLIMRLVIPALIHISCIAMVAKDVHVCACQCSQGICTELEPFNLTHHTLGNLTYSIPKSTMVYVCTPATHKIFNHKGEK